MPVDVKYREEIYGVTWEELVELEPRLGDLLHRVESARPTEGATEFDYERSWMHFKEPIADLVGWHRKSGDEKLRTCYAYEIAYYTLLNVLHD